MRHSIDCDGYRVTHLASVHTFTMVGATGHNRTFQAVCADCEWFGGRFGPDAEAVAEREARDHYAEVQCAGECVEATARTFGEVIYAD